MAICQSTIDYVAKHISCLLQQGFIIWIALFKDNLVLKGNDWRTVNPNDFWFIITYPTLEERILKDSSISERKGMI